MLVIVSNQLTPGAVERLEHEFALRDILSPEWAATPLSLKHEDSRTVLVLTDPGGERLSGLLAQPWEVGAFLRAALGMTVALGRVHAQGLIHKDIKPDHFLVDRTSGAAWLTGFGIASQLLRERQAPDRPETIAGTLAYMAPEQTGRMNRSIDARSDLYALGVTWYQMLTGELPFSAKDPMELVHCHIARQPPVPMERNADIPAALSAIVLRLLAKPAEERYQTAVGVARDLQRCLDQWNETGRIDAFALGAEDRPDRLLIPEKLYGRGREVQTLLATFDRVVQGGPPELVLVSGYAGIGKSSVVNELQKALVPPRGIFASGKFDQYKRDIPYSTLAQAFQALARGLLAMNEAELAPWREALREAVGRNGRLVTELIPELELLIGEQPEVPELPPQDARRRFQLVFQRFVGVFARPEHPLALFLDDLQWLDAGSLDLMEHLLTRSELHHLLLIGAYRDHEVGPAHPLLRTLDAVRSAKTPIHQLVLEPLGPDDLGHLVADSLQCERSTSEALAQLLHERSGGNPFFAIQFLTALAEEGLLAFDHGAAQWSWDLDGIRAKAYTANVVDLMVDKLSRLPIQSRQALEKLACLGNTADVAVLELVHGDSDEGLQGVLRHAIRSGLVLFSGTSYRFLHDRIQEAAYSLIPAGQRAEAHLRMGRLLAARMPAERQEEAVFEIVNQFNRGSALIEAPEERERLAELNLVAGRRAKAATAYVSALHYLVAGAALLPDGWRHRPDLLFALELQRAECEFLTGDVGAAEARLEMLTSKVERVVDRAAVACLLSDLYTTLNRSDRAIGVCLAFFQRTGIEWSAHPTEAEAGQEYRRTWELLGARKVEDLIDLPLMRDADTLATLDVLVKALSPAMFTDPNLCSLLLWRMVNLSLQHGNCDASSYAYTHVAVVAGPRFGNFKAGQEFGQLGKALLERRGMTRFVGRAMLAFAVFTSPGIRPLRETGLVLKENFEMLSRGGDVTYAAFSLHNLLGVGIAAGDPLAEVEREADGALAYVRKVGFGIVIDNIATQRALVRSLRGSTRGWGCLSDAGFDEAEMERRLTGDPGLVLPACWYWIRKLQARYFAGDYAEAIAASESAEPHLWTSGIFMEMAEALFYGALSRAACCEGPSGTADREHHFRVLLDRHRQLAQRAEHCPGVYEPRERLVSAEIARIQGQELEAERLYDLAIKTARTYGYVHNEALACELNARFHFARGLEEVGLYYLRKARQGYARWGADAKVQQLEQAHPELREEGQASPLTGTISAPTTELDLATVIKLSEALSSEIVLEKMLDTVMRLAIAHAGAARGLLILARPAEHWVIAEVAAEGDAVSVQMRDHPVAADSLPQSVLQYVLRTRESVILGDAVAGGPFGSDAYIRERRPRSVLCLPLVKQSTLIGVLYLENRLATRAFTPGRTAILELLASQAAIALEKALLYADLRRNEALLKQAQRLSSTGSWYWRVAGDVVEFSEQTYAIYEFEAGRTITLELIATRIHPEDLGLLQEMIDLARSGAPGIDYLYRARMPDGRVKHLHLVAQGTRDKRGELECIGAIQDVTQRHLAEEALGNARSELAHAARVSSLGALTASIAHEVNQPLAGIVMNASTTLRMLAADPPNLDGVRNATQRTLRDGTRASEVIARLRALLSKKRGVVERVDLNEATREVITLSKAEMLKCGVVLRLDLADALPAVSGDRVQLQQVVLNLLLNALEAMSEVDHSRRALHVATEVEGDQVRLTVRDTGVGIDGALAQRLFEPFYTTKTNGMGIGLSVSRTIVEGHGGVLCGESNGDDPGATFSVVLPRSAPEAAA